MRNLGLLQIENTKILNTSNLCVCVCVCVMDKIKCHMLYVSFLNFIYLFLQGIKPALVCWQQVDKLGPGALHACSFTLCGRFGQALSSGLRWRGKWLPPTVPAGTPVSNQLAWDIKTCTLTDKWVPLRKNNNHIVDVLEKRTSRAG